LDIATIIGLIMGVGLILGAIMMGGGSGINGFIDFPSMMITVGGSIAALLINFPLASCLGVFGVVKNCFLTKVPDSNSVINQFKEFATVVRRDGLLALEEKIESLDHSFMKRGLEMVVAGTPKDDLRSVLETEISYSEQRHQTGKKILDATAAAAPAFGMIGTLIGLVQMLQELDDPSKIGLGMATALLTTLYGALIANVFCIPLAGKLEARSNEEGMVLELMMEGLLSLVDGQTPRAIEERLHAYLSPSKRVAEAPAAEAA
jgi:chemotaxis protein MotA